MIYYDENLDDGFKNSHASIDRPAGKSKIETMKCSLCSKSFEKSESKCLPFCSKRCQQIDLGHWLNESYGMPIESGEEPHSAEAEEELDIDFE